MPLLVKTKASCNARVAYSLTPCAKTSAESSSQKPGSKELDAKIASYLNENGIAFYTAASLSFSLIIEERMRLARQNLLLSCKVPHQLKFFGEPLDNAYESTEKHAAL